MRLSKSVGADTTYLVWGVVHRNKARPWLACGRRGNMYCSCSSPVRHWDRWYPGDQRRVNLAQVKLVMPGLWSQGRLDGQGLSAKAHSPIHLYQAKVSLLLIHEPNEPIALAHSLLIVNHCNAIPMLYLQKIHAYLLHI